MSALHVIDETVLLPLSPDRPCGSDITGALDWVKIRDARPNAYAAASQGDWERADRREVSWPALKTLVSDALSHKTKDLRLAAWLLEASLQTDRIAGLRDGLCMIRELITRYWDAGLYPLPDGNDHDARLGALEWFDEKLPELILALPVTMRTSPETNYSVRHHKEILQANASVTAAQFEAAALDGTLEQYVAVRSDVEQAAAEVAQLKEVVKQKFGEKGPAFIAVQEALDDFRTAVNSIIRKMNPQESATQDSKIAAGPPSVPPRQNEPTAYTGSAGEDDPWDAAMQLVRSGPLDQALARMTQLASAEPNGRARFERKLVLADICLSTRRNRIAVSILEELAELIEKHQLESWETSELIGAVWTRLHDCYRNEAAGTADPERAAKLFQRICRLNPWQALSCSTN
jgi:type VI secretion system protein ImpA